MRRKRSVVVARAVPDPVPSGIYRQCRDDNHVELAWQGRHIAGTGLSMTEGVGRHRISVRHEPEFHRVEARIDDGVGNRHTSSPEEVIELPQVDFVTVLDRPEQRDRPGEHHRLELCQARDDSLRSLRARGLGKRIPQATHPFAELALDAPAQRFLRRSRDESVVIGRHAPVAV